MAYKDLTRKDKNSCKKSKSYFATLIDVTDTDVGLVSTNLLLGNLPPNAIVTDAYAHRVTASNADTSATLALGTAEGGAQIMASCMDLANNPQLGKSYEILSLNVLGYKCGQHIIFYREILKNEIEIARVLHGMMDLKTKI